MSKINLTANRVREFDCPPGAKQVFLWDAATEGLGLRATSGGTCYVFQAKLKGKTIRISIGSPKSWDLSRAREQARAYRTQIDGGRDPRVVKAEALAADAAKRALYRVENAEALEAWNEYIAARSARWSPRHKADHETASRPGGEKITRGRRAGMGEVKEPGMLRPLLLLPLSGITRDRVAAWLETEVVKRPTRTRLALSLLSTFLAWCGTRPEYRDQVHSDACTKMKRDLPKAQAKDDCLQREQLKSWFDHVRKLPNITNRTYLQCLLLTGARREELAGVRWEDVDFQWKTILIGDKVEGNRTIPLTPYVADLLLALQSANNTPPHPRILKRMESAGKKWRPSPWVFASKSAKSGRIQEPRLAHNKALDAAGLPPLSIHGLRRSFGTLAEWVECPAGISAQIMGHRPSAIAEKHYRKRPIDLLRMWHSKIEGWILNEAGIEQPKDSATAPARLTSVV